MRIVHALMWRVPVTKQQRSNLATLVLIGVVTAGFLMTIAIDRLDRLSIVGLLAGLAVSVLVPGAAWLLISTVLPHAPGASWQDMLPGALLFGSAALLLHLFTIIWISNLVEHRSQTYGAIAAALAVLLWAYVLGRLITASAALNRSTFRRAQADA
jgi:uncharacterized BrkB/YihY/UPF0761 family membrane protein